MTNDKAPIPVSFEGRLHRTSLIMAAVLSAAVWLAFSWQAALSFAIGGALSTLNFHWLKQAVDFIVLRGGAGPIGKRIALKYAARYALIGLILYVTIRVSFMDTAFVLAGLLIYVFAVLLEAIIEIGKSLVRDYRNGRTSTTNRRYDQ